MQGSFRFSFGPWNIHEGADPFGPPVRPVDLRRAFMQVWVLDRNGYGNNGEFIGLDVKAVRTQKADQATQHLANSREIFLALLDVVRKLDTARLNSLIAERNYEQLEMEIIRGLLGK